MPEPQPLFFGIVLYRQLAGEHHLRLHLAAPERGLLRVLARHASKGTPPPPDLFDAGDFTVEASRGNAYFLKDFRLQRRRTELAQSYAAFEAACEFAEVFRKNLEHLEEPAEPVALLERGLDAFETGQRPEVTLLKSLYLLARMEGFPVKEEWLIGLPGSLRRQAKEVLNSPLTEQTVDSATVESLLHSLRAWLRGVDFIL